MLSILEDIRSHTREKLVYRSVDLSYSLACVCCFCMSAIFQATVVTAYLCWGGGGACWGGGGACGKGIPEAVHIATTGGARNCATWRE